eukprot:CAMPEP_0172027746 /NCGR_PEP_ID=MMETSP1041-20130122/17171_1 /TAXON_ID=464988 /ORGANISM="Hemiselmis andersenii, Strain CCMP439" /LENGTH=92 /DNA_ID=CAMNT_0012683681 /DNA_START=28 /DNA_END=303 /DNA_ORIENTATION=+
MDRKGTRGNSHPYAEQEFNAMLTDAHIDHWDSLEFVLLFIAIVFVAIWWKTSLGTGSYFARHAASNAGASNAGVGVDAEMTDSEYVGYNGYR